MAYKMQQNVTTIEGAVSDAFSDIDSLRDECESWRDGMQGTNLENSSKYETLDEAVSALENAQEVTVPDVLCAQPLTVSYSVNKRKGRGVSRSRRLGDACGYLQAAIDAANELAGDDDEGEEVGPLRTALEAHLGRTATDEEMQSAREEIEEFTDELQTAIDEVESVEFPGMFG